MPHRPEIVWCSTSQEIPERLSEMDATEWRWVTSLDDVGDCDAAVINDDVSIPDPSALTNIGAPLLVLTDEESASSRLEHLSEEHQVALSTEPTALLRFRIQRLLRVASGRRDDLSGLLVRRALLRHLERFLATTHAGSPTSVALIDIDEFKGINDRLGHQDGDRVIRHLARVLEDASPAGVVLARYGGDEIAMIGRASAHGARTASEQIRQHIAGRTLFDDVQITVSIGVATATRPVSAQALLREVDEALYAAKAQGRNQVVHFRELRRAARERGADTALTTFENVTRVVSERVARMISRRGRKLVDAVRNQAEIDGVTELFTRRYLDRRLAEEFQTATRRSQALTVALLDVDHFGEVNKKWGWPTGDKLLREVASVARSILRGDDWVARYGGDEISIVMPETSLDDALMVMGRVKDALAEHRFESTTGEVIAVTVSMGLAERQPSDRSVGEILERSSDRLLQAKRTGRDRIML